MNPNAALVVIDVQVMMFDESDPVYQGDALLTKIHALIAQARAAGAPVIFVRHDEPGTPMAAGTPGWQLHPTLVPQSEDLIIDKRTPDAFYETPLQEELAARGIKRLVLVGIQTEICVDTTCRCAFSNGYQVTLVKDAHSTWNSPTLTAQQIIDHHNATLRWFGDVKESAAITF
jgi:nicotinamidase-related amidase